MSCLFQQIYFNSVRSVKLAVDLSSPSTSGMAKVCVGNGLVLLQEGEPYQRPLRWCQWAGHSPSYCTPAWAQVTDDSAFTGEEMRSQRRGIFRKM